ncbi:3-deoxy-manno-octulosonate cytidylyltransferase [Chloropicon primus]|uniref:3-deoxy-manno-octulosonate cytidylyltransferase n=1 Tax=Chloropicon primus TaxID=1764295 RepID=A0A5B8MYP3_9CHLO|nr:3-deoxy-manno-octulosonate cytidylyltransferase [Chloropicon primus]|eukprot:QDZ25481.1 3-deoxy-manno-octulosonate cytidylyltransferase [Chloropicon primus]
MSLFGKKKSPKEDTTKITKDHERSSKINKHLATFVLHAFVYEVVAKRFLPKVHKWLHNRMTTNKVLGVIPARYNSTRFPGKPLADLCGNPMIWHTYTNAKKSNCFDELVVATDDERIAECVRDFGGKVVMTSESCNNGTERCLEVLQHLGEKNYDIVVNVQGDEPFIESEHVEKVVDCIRSGIEAGDASVVMGTLARPANLNDSEDVTNVNNVKVVLDKTNNALYFSRAMIPYNKRGKYDPKVSFCLFVDFSHWHVARLCLFLTLGLLSPTLKCLYWRKLGIYAYRASFLNTYVNEMPQSLLQKQEDLEQNKVIEAGYKIKVGLVEKAVHGVDTPEQLRHLNGMLKTKKGIYI